MMRALGRQSQLHRTPALFFEEHQIGVLQVQVICFAGGSAAALGKNGNSSPRSLFQHPAPSFGHTFKNISAPLNPQKPFLS
jgi:hypothetical protein